MIHACTSTFKEPILIQFLYTYVMNGAAASNHLPVMPDVGLGLILMFTPSITFCCIAATETLTHWIKSITDYCYDGKSYL